MRSGRWILLAVCIAQALPCLRAGQDNVDLLAQVGRTRGLCVLLEDKGCAHALDLARRSELLLYVEFAEDADVAEARRAADAAGLYGVRIFIDRGPGARIGLADGIADALIAVGAAARVSAREALRVVRPGGRAFIGGQVLTAPEVEGAGAWTHPYHLPDNNTQSHDTAARAPYLTRFLAGPYYAPLPQMTVAAGGRVFRALGHIAFKPREEQWTDTLMCINAYNGTILWHRPIEPGIMVHRNTMVATPSVLYYADHVSLKVIDAETGALKDEIAPPPDVVGGSFWKWLALEDGVLYAVIGEDEFRDPAVRRSNPHHGWPWHPLSQGFNMGENPWGFGRTLLAIDPGTKRILWLHREDEPMDTRAVCMKSGRIFAFRFGSYLTCIDARTGAVLWRRTPQEDPGVFAALGRDLGRQDWQTNWRTVAYLKAGDGALYFAGPIMDKLVCLSSEDGRVLWTYPYDNFQIILRSDGLWGISGPWGQNASRRFEPLTGKVLGEYEVGRRACTRPTGAVDAILYRANGGSVRLNAVTGRPEYVSPMRPNCHDGVTIAHGLLTWWPSVCDCQLTLYGATCLGPAGDYRFGVEAQARERLETLVTEAPRPFAHHRADWPSLRADSRSTARSMAAVPAAARVVWSTPPMPGVTPTAPSAAGGLVFVSGSDGIVRALDAAGGQARWEAFTGGGVRIAPSVWDRRVYVGAGDGWAYALEAASGRILWRFRAAPQERRIPVYGRILSTWPAASGVLVDGGTAYVAAGISNFDGTHVYALDAATGAVKWQNNTSGHLNAEGRTGVGVQGQLLLHGGKLYMAGGNAVSPAVYDAADGTCLNRGDLLNTCESICLRGWELYLVGDKVAVGGQPFYGDPVHPVADPTVVEKILHVPLGDRDIVWQDDRVVHCYAPLPSDVLDRCVRARTYPGRHIIPSWGVFKPPSAPKWSHACPGSEGVAVCANAVVIAARSSVTAVSLADGTPLWSVPLPAAPVRWGIAVDRDGRVIVALKNGQVVCVGAAKA